MSLVGDSKVIILDEPTANLDLIAKQKVWDYINTIKNDKCILVATHNIEEADYLSDTICVI